MQGPLREDLTRISTRSSFEDLPVQDPEHLQDLNARPPSEDLNRISRISTRSSQKDLYVSQKDTQRILLQKLLTRTAPQDHDLHFARA